MIRRYHDLPPEMELFAASNNNTVLLESSRPDAQEHTSFLFSQPQALLRLERLEDAPQFFRTG